MCISNLLYISVAMIVYDNKTNLTICVFLTYFIFLLQLLYRRILPLHYNKYTQQCITDTWEKWQQKMVKGPVNEKSLTKNDVILFLFSLWLVKYFLNSFLLPCISTTARGLFSEIEMFSILFFCVEIMQFLIALISSLLVDSIKYFCVMRFF